MWFMVGFNANPTAFRNHSEKNGDFPILTQIRRGNSLKISQTFALVSPPPKMSDLRTPVSPPCNPLSWFSSGSVRHNWIFSSIFHHDFQQTAGQPLEIKMHTQHRHVSGEMPFKNHHFGYPGIHMNYKGIPFTHVVLSWHVAIVQPRSTKVFR